MASSVPFTLEGAHQHRDNSLVLYRIRVPAQGTVRSGPGPRVRYLTAPSPPEGASPFPDHRGDNLGFDTVPSGDWNLGHLVLSDSNTGKFVLASTETADLEQKVGLLNAGTTWHNTNLELIDLLDAFYAQRELQQDDNDNATTSHPQTAGHISAAILPLTTTTASASSFSSPSEAVGIWAWQPDLTHGIANETHIYSLLEARAAPGSIAPRFLGHITDNGTRVVGFLVEKYAAARAAGHGDLAECKKVLAKLHAAGVAYGGVLRKDSFLVREDGAAMMQRFGGAFETEDGEVLAKEMEKLEEVLGREEGV
jgi:hypothetical protein